MQYIRILIPVSWEYIKNKESVVTAQRWAYDYCPPVGIWLLFTSGHMVTAHLWAYGYCSPVGIKKNRYEHILKINAIFCRPSITLRQQYINFDIKFWCPVLSKVDLNIGTINLLQNVNFRKNECFVLHVHLRIICLEA